jgi:hypothetical protein
LDALRFALCDLRFAIFEVSKLIHLLT